MRAVVRRIKAGADSIRRFLDEPAVRRWIVPYRKPVAGFVTGLLTYALREVGLLEALPAGLTEVLAAAFVAYWVPEAGPDLTPQFEPDEEFTERINASMERNQDMLDRLRDGAGTFGDPPDHTPDVEAHEESVTRNEDDGPGVV